MPLFGKTRRVLVATTLVAAPFVFSLLHAQPAQKPSAPAPKVPAHVKPSVPKVNGPHLSEWMRSHRSLSPDQQQQALQHEPGFNSLPSATQQRMKDQIQRLNSMPPERRERLLERNEAMEHLTPDQRGQVRSAMQQLAALPPDQRRYVARTFRGLRELKPDQRANVLNSDRFSSLTPDQRSTLTTLMKVEPLLPPPYDPGNPATQPATHP